MQAQAQLVDDAEGQAVKCMRKLHPRLKEFLGYSQEFGWGPDIGVCAQLLYGRGSRSLPAVRLLSKVLRLKIGFSSVRRTRRVCECSLAARSSGFHRRFLSTPYPMSARACAGSPEPFGLEQFLGL